MAQPITLGLGYDPRPEVRAWHGTPIPPVRSPLAATPEFVRIADRMWWNGPPWTILRNREVFLKQAMDWTSHEDFLYLWENIPREDWVGMLEGVRPGEVSRRSYRLCARMAGVLPIGVTPSVEWLPNLHVKDMLFEDYRGREFAEKGPAL